VTIDELVTGVSIALGDADAGACAGLDRDQNGRATVDELVAAVDGALRGCVPKFTPTPVVPLATSTPTTTATPSPTATSAPTQSVPTTLAEIEAWLRTGSYLDWQAESATHPPAGPHGARVRTFVNDVLFASLLAGGAQHPAQSAAVKEIYDSGENLLGWAVEVKVQADSAGGQGWYWYEFGSAGRGLPVCTGCHSLGVDYFRTPFPLH